MDLKKETIDAFKDSKKEIKKDTDKLINGFFLLIIAVCSSSNEVAIQGYKFDVSLAVSLLIWSYSCLLLKLSYSICNQNHLSKNLQEEHNFSEKQLWAISPNSSLSLAGIIKEITDKQSANWMINITSFFGAAIVFYLPFFIYAHQMYTNEILSIEMLAVLVSIVLNIVAIAMVVKVSPKKSSSILS